MKKSPHNNTPRIGSGLPGSCASGCRVLLMEPIRFHQERFGRFLRLMERFFFHQEHPTAANNGNPLATGLRQCAECHGNEQTGIAETARHSARNRLISFQGPCKISSDDCGNCYGVIVHPAGTPYSPLGQVTPEARVKVPVALVPLIQSRMAAALGAS